jgi:TolA-binding protein
MLIKGDQRNNQIARAYLLLGKARYYNGKYLQAIEAFTYLVKNMSSAKSALLLKNLGHLVCRNNLLS